MALNISQPPVVKSVVSIASSQATGSSAAFALPIADSYSFYLNITTGGQTTCDIIFQTSVDGGTTYVNVPWRFQQITTATGLWFMDVHCGVGPAAGPNGTLTSGEGDVLAATGGHLTLGAVVDPLHMKLGYTVSGTAPIGTLYVAAWPRGTRGVFDE